MKEGLLYSEWKKELGIWSDFTDLEKKKQGGALFLTLTGKARQAVLAEVTRDELKKETGLEAVLKCLDELYLKDDDQSGYAAYDDFTNYRRPVNTSIQDYIVDFNVKYGKIKSFKMELPDGVLAYYLLKCANLTEEQTNICRATCTKLTYKDMRQQIEKVTSNCDLVSAKSESVAVAVEPQFYEEDDGPHEHDDYQGEYNEYPTEETYYSQQPQYRPRPTSASFKSSTGNPRQNAPDEFGNPTRCAFCQSTYHWISRCPDAPRQSGGIRRGARGFRRGRGRPGSGYRGQSKQEKYIWLGEHLSEPEIENVTNVILATETNVDDVLLSETIGYAIIDSGCTRTVCGETWLNTYLDTLPNNIRRQVYSESSECHFRFGDGEVFHSDRVVMLPVQFGSESAKLGVNIVTCDIPLLLSRITLKRAGCRMDFTRDRVILLGEEVPVKISSSGHYCVPLMRNSDQYPRLVSQIMFSSPIHPDVDSVTVNKKKILKLHKQFAHPAPERLKKLIRNSGVDDDNIMKLVDNISDSCDICKRFRKPPSRPVVGFPLASEFNQTVAMDIKYINSQPVLHMIDHASRFSTACLLRNKKTETVIQAVMQNWIQIFGQPQSFLTDNGGEFVNSQLLELAEKFNISLKTTAAESAWSNGMCERHNAVIEDMVNKVQADTRCNMSLALSWAISAKNSLYNVYGFSPNQLVFGKNCNFPAVHLDKLPAQNVSCTNRLIADHLIALHKARQAFISQESCEKLRRALNKQTRTYSDTVYQNGDNVYYKRDKSSEWHGPARVLGKDGAQHLLKHGGVYIRVHPCKMQLIEGDNSQSDALASSEDFSNNNKRELPAVHLDTNDAGNEDDEDERTNVPLGVPPLSPPPTPARDHNAEAFRPSPRPDVAEEIMEDEPAAEPDLEVSASSSEPELEEVKEDNFSIHEDGVSQLTKKPRALARLENYNAPGLKESTSSFTSDDTEEIYFGQASEGARFDGAKQEELQKWIDMDVYIEVENTGQPYVTTRWVCTEKMKGGRIVQKARLVARGFEEDASQLRKDSPTCNKESLRMLLCILAANNWQLRTIDIKSAYLQGCPISRDLYILPPECAKTDKLWKLIKTPYGLVDAGRKWYIRVMKEFTALGAHQAKCDQAVYIWSDPSGQGPCGILVAHVDDFLYGGNDYFLTRVLPLIRKMFIIGVEETQSLKYLGLSVKQTSEYITLSNDGYAESIREIDTQNTGTDKSRLLTKEESVEMRHVIGQINWITSQTRPDVSFFNCMIANSTKNPTVSDLLQVNKTVRRIRSQRVSLIFPSSLDLSTCQLVAFCDASFANLPDRGSQGGFIIFVIDFSGRYCPIAWQSKRVKKVVNSSLAAECFAALEAAETCIWLRNIFVEYLCCDEREVKISIMCDNKSLVHAVHTSTSVENKRVQISISSLREMVNDGDIFQFRWIETSKQVANALTKAGASTDYLLNVLRHSLSFSHESGCFS